MSLIRQLSVLAVCQILGDRADSLLAFVGERFNDHGSRLESALAKSSERAWHCLEVALAGQSWWDSCKSMLSARDEQTLHRQIRSFLAGLPPTELPGDADTFRKLALAELRGARKVGLVPGQNVSAGDVAGDHARVFARYGDPKSLIERDRHLLDGMSNLLDREGYTHLAKYVGLRPAGGQPLLVQAVRYFFRREIEADDRLATSLTMEKLDGLDSGLQAGFEGMHAALGTHALKVETLLAGLAGTLAATHQGVVEVGTKVTATMEVVTGTRDDVKTLKAQLEQQGEELRQLTGLLKQMLEQRPATAPTPAPVIETPRVVEPVPVAPSTVRRPLASPATPADSTTDWGQVRQLLARVKKITPEEKQNRPELAQVMGQLARAEERFEATRQRYTRLQTAEAGGAPLPVVPGERPILDALPVEEPPPGRRPGGRLISALFQTGQPASSSPPAPPPAAEAPADDAAKTATTARRKLISSLFDQGKGEADAGKPG